MNTQLLEFVAAWEALKLRSSEDPLVPEIYDVGYGHVIHKSEHPMTVTREQAMDMLVADLTEIENQVKRMVTVPTLEHEVHALTSFSYNCGVRALSRSTLLALLNSGDYGEASNQFARWNKANGRIVHGLVKRRAAERDMFLYADYSKRP